MIKCRSLWEFIASHLSFGFITWVQILNRIQRTRADRRHVNITPPTKCLNFLFCPSIFFFLPEHFKHLRLISTNGVSHQIKRFEGFNWNSKTFQPPPFTSCPQRELVRAEHEHWLEPIRTIEVLWEFSGIRNKAEIVQSGDFVRCVISSVYMYLVSLGVLINEEVLKDDD